MNTIKDYLRSSDTSQRDVEMHYVRRDLDRVDRNVHHLHGRVSRLERRGSWIERLGAILIKTDWKTWAVIGLLILGLTGHLTANDAKQYIEALSQ